MTSDEYDVVRATIDKHGICYGYGHTWATDSAGGSQSISGIGFATKEEADEAKLRSLVAAGYESKKWWQWWRWGEVTPDVWTRTTA